MLSFEGATHLDWAKELPGSVTICDKDAVIIYMNDKAIEQFNKTLKDNFIGKSLFDCHNEHSCEILKKMLKEETSNFYTIEKNSVKRFVSQIPWRQNGKYMGIVEISLEIPSQMPHHIR